MIPLKGKKVAILVVTNAFRWVLAVSLVDFFHESFLSKCRETKKRIEDTNLYSFPNVLQPFLILILINLIYYYYDFGTDSSSTF